MKRILEVFTDEEHIALKNAKINMQKKENKPLNWHDFILKSAGVKK